MRVLIVRSLAIQRGEVIAMSLGRELVRLSLRALGNVFVLFSGTLQSASRSYLHVRRLARRPKGWDNLSV